jgi:hypothetical protein
MHLTLKYKALFMRYIFIALLFAACTNTERPKQVTEKLDTIQTAPKVITQPALLETAFIKGTIEKINNADIYLYGITIGQIKIITGRIVACDPLHIEEYGIPYTQTFPTGEFPVQLSISKVENTETVCFARIKFSDEPVVRWELALIKDQKPLPVGDEKIHGYGVDAGIGIFADDSTLKTIRADTTIYSDEDIYRKIKAEMDKHYHDEWKYAMNAYGQNVAAFSTGLGDGRYASYIGFDANGKPCRLVTDFGLFNWKAK